MLPVQLFFSHNYLDASTSLTHQKFQQKKTTAINYNENLTKKNKKFTETRNIRRKLQIERIPCSSTRAAVLTTLLCLDGWGGSSTRSCFKLLRKRTANNTFQDLLLHKKSFLFSWNIISTIVYTNLLGQKANTDVSMWGEDGRDGVCCSNCGHWKTIIGYMETWHDVAKIQPLKYFNLFNISIF